MTRPWTSARSGCCQRASSQPTRIPGTRLAPTASAATRTERSTTSRSVSPSTRGSSLGEREAGFREQLARSLAAQVAEEAPRFGRARGPAQGRRVVLDRRMARRIEGEEQRYRGNPRVGRVDEARRELPLLDGVEDRAHVLLADETRGVGVEE